MASQFPIGGRARTPLLVASLYSLFLLCPSPFPKWSASYEGLQPGAHVNLERALPSDGHMSEYLIQGHIEATVAVLSVKEGGMARNEDIHVYNQARKSASGCRRDRL